MKRNFLKYLPFYIALLFFVFPIVYFIEGSYPFSSFIPTLCAIISYLILINIDNKYAVFSTWFYLLGYIALMTIYVYPMNFLFIFFPINLLIWRFGDEVLSYRFISFLVTIHFLLIYVFVNYKLEAKIFIAVFYSIAMLTLAVQLNLINKNKLEKEKIKYNEHINILSAENERNRISRDLHDTLGHVFVTLSLKSELANKLLEKGNLDEVHKHLSEINDISKKSIKEVRDLINNLKFRTVEEELSVIEELLSLANIKCNINNYIDSEHLTNILQSTITMILREATNNIIKHSEADFCEIILKENAKEIVVTVSDNGVGFDSKGSIDLKSIRDRIVVANGALTFLSTKNPTTIKITLPK